MNFKKILLVAVLVLSLFAFVGCSKEPSGEVKGVTDGTNDGYDTVQNDGNEIKDDVKRDMNEVKDNAEDMIDGTNNSNTTQGALAK